MRGDAATLPLERRALEWRVSPGLTGYGEAMTAMEARVRAIREGEAGELAWLLEHPPLYTAGSSARDVDLRDPGRFPTHRAGRGGQWTYHGPGQCVAYVMLDLARPHGLAPARDVRGYVWALEEWLIRALGLLGVAGGRREGRVGIWVDEGARESKVAALGVRVTRWVSWHGVALNVDPDLGHFGGIVPCGLESYGVTSLRALGRRADMAMARAALSQAWDGVFGDAPLHAADPAAMPSSRSREGA